MPPGPTCFQPVRSFPLNSSFHCGSEALAAIRKTAASTMNSALNLRMWPQPPLSKLRREHISQHEPEIRGALCQPPHKPGLPVGTVCNKHHRAMSLATQAFLLGTLDAIAHLH